MTSEALQQEQSDVISVKALMYLILVADCTGWGEGILWSVFENCPVSRGSRQMNFMMVPVAEASIFCWFNAE